MREFKILPKVQDFELNMIAKILDKEIPSIVCDYIKKYSGEMIEEKFFLDKNGLEWELSQFNLFKDLYALSDEFLKAYKSKLIPFAYDPGGWHFCLCLDEGANDGAIIINRWTDHLPEEQFLKIAENFEEFINGLKTEDEINL